MTTRQLYDSVRTCGQNTYVQLVVLDKDNRAELHVVVTRRPQLSPVSSKQERIAITTRIVG